MFLDKNRKVSDQLYHMQTFIINRNRFDFIQPTRPTMEQSGVRIRNYIYMQYDPFHCAPFHSMCSVFHTMLFHTHAVCSVPLCSVPFHVFRVLGNKYVKCVGPFHSVPCFSNDPYSVVSIQTWP